MPPPPDSPLPPEPPPVGVRVSDVHAVDGQITFTLTIDNRAPGWTGQDWVLVAGEASPLAIRIFSLTRTPVVAQCAGQAVPGRGSTTHRYFFDARTSHLGLREDGGETVIATSGDGVGEGIWMLTLRLLRTEDHGTYVAHEEVAVIPVLQIEISETGEVAGFVYDNARDETGPSGTAVHPEMREESSAPVASIAPLLPPTHSGHRLGL